MSNTTVLIVGSGPTGLIMAAELASRGVPCRLIDRLASPVTTSRAFTIHARTLELLDKMGVEEEFLSRSTRTKSMDYHFPNKPDVPKLDFTELSSAYPYCLTINQSDTEAILRDHVTSLGVTIEWNTKLTHLADTADGLTATLQNTQTAEEETIHPEWIIGCDGFYSTVRKHLDLPLEGENYEGMMKMIDVKVNGFEDSHDAIHYYVSKDHMLLINKLPGENFRVLISDKNNEIPQEEARVRFQEVIDKRFKGTVTIDEPVWATNFYIGRRQVNSYRHGNIFLAGDAAHVNSPAGGQGMNVSMQDAFNLGWKLAMVINGKAHESLLASYQAERLPVAAQMLEGTDYIHSIIMAHGRGMAERLERLNAPGWNKEAVNQIAGISYTYRPVDVEDPLAAGDRAPDAVLADGSRIYDRIATDSYTLFLIADAAADTETLQSLAEQTAARYAAPVTTHVIPAESEITQRYPAGQAYLLRPDCHIAYIGDVTDIDGWQAYLDGVLVKS